jgi:hypothetical protein
MLFNAIVVTHTSPCYPCQPMPPIPAYLNLFLFHYPHCTLLQNSAPQSERSCPVNMISLSGSTAGRRNIFSNSRIKGAPVTVFGITVISCIFVGICGRFCERILELLGTALVDGRVAFIGASSHFSIRNIDCTRFIEMIITIFTSFPEFSSHHLASNLR